MSDKPIEEVTPSTRKEYRFLEARAKAETAECEKRLAMQEFRPCRLYPVLIYHDGMRWVCSYGVMPEEFSMSLPGAANGESGVEAYGECPEEACQNFDAMWHGVTESKPEEDEPEEEDGWQE